MLIVRHALIDIKNQYVHELTVGESVLQSHANRRDFLRVIEVRQTDQRYSFIQEVVT